MREGYAVIETVESRQFSANAPDLMLLSDGFHDDWQMIIELAIEVEQKQAQMQLQQQEQQQQLEATEAS